MTAHVDEHVHQYRRPVSEEERASFGYGNQKWRQIKEPTGRLQIALYGKFPSDLPCQWIDEDDAPLEGWVQEPLAGFLVATVHEVAKEEENARREKDALERLKQREAAKKARELEANRRRDLLNDVSRWKQAGALREFLTEVRVKAAPDSEPEPGMPLEAWLQWAGRVADSLDPFIDDEGAEADE